MKKAEGVLHTRSWLIRLSCLLLGAVVLGCGDKSSRSQPGESAVPIITKLPMSFTKRIFDPTNPPPDMPPMTRGEEALCESNFQSKSIVSGHTHLGFSSHGTVTVTQVKMTLQLSVTIWVPPDASQHVMEHEEGHREIAEYYYQTADKIAAQIAAKYIGRQVEVSGADLNAESNKLLNQMAMEINAEYDKELNPEPIQLLYDSITDHSRNGVEAKDAVAHAIKNVLIESPQSSSSN
jgi:hypothetical protein